MLLPYNGVFSTMVILAWIVLVLIIFGIGAWCFILVRSIGMEWSSRLDAPLVETPQSVVREFIQRIPMDSTTRFLELGSAEGKVIRRVVRMTGAAGTGVEMSLPLLWLARLSSWIDRTQSKIVWQRRRIQDAELGSADVIFIFMVRAFLNGPVMTQKWLTELQPGTHVVSHWFEIDVLKPYKIGEWQTGKHVTYIYRKTNSNDKIQIHK